MFKFVLCLAVSIVQLSHVRAKVSEESKQLLVRHFDRHMVECGKELSLDVEKIKKLHVSIGKFEGIDKCFVGCVLKKDGTINAEGKFDLHKALRGLKKIIKKGDDLKAYEAASKACLSVNDEKMSDGDKGCERAYKVLNCINKKKICLKFERNNNINFDVIMKQFNNIFTYK